MAKFKKEEGADVRLNLNPGVAEKNPPSLQREHSGVGKRRRSNRKKRNMTKIMSYSPASSLQSNSNKLDESAGTSTHKKGQDVGDVDQDCWKLAQVASEILKEEFPEAHAALAAGEKNRPPVLQQDQSGVEKGTYSKKRVSPSSIHASNFIKLNEAGKLQETSVKTYNVEPNEGGTSTDKKLQRKVAHRYQQDGRRGMCTGIWRVGCWYAQGR